MNKLPDKIPVLHIVTAAPQNARGLMEFVNAHNDDNTHYFLFDSTIQILNQWPEWCKYQYCGLFLPGGSKLKRYRFIKQVIERADKVVLYGMYFSRKIYYFLLHWNPQLLKKFTWIEWGADLYEWRSPVTGFISRKMDQIGQEIRDRIPQVVLTFPVDELIFRRNHGNFAETIPLSLPSTRPMLPRIDAAYAEKKTDKLRIQVGHNGLLSTNQIRTLDTLSKFKDENIQVVIPLAYNIGNLSNTIDKQAYKSAVISVAKNYFGNKAVPFVNMIRLDYYMRYLWTVDIVIFDFKRPCGLGNLFFMIYMGKKVFLPADSDYYKFLTDNGIKVYDTNRISEMSFEEFSAPPEPSDPSFINDLYDYEKNIRSWEQLFATWTGKELPNTDQEAE